MIAARHISLLGRLSGSAMQALHAAPGVQRCSPTHAFSVQAAAAAEPQEAEKKPNSAYITFVSDNYKAVKAKNPEAQSKDIMTLLGAEWKSLGNARKEKYKADAVKAKAAYEAKYPPGSQPKRVPKAKKVKAEDKPVKPKRAPSAYNMYMAQRLPALKKPGAPATEALSLVAKEWKTLSQTEKDEWKVKAAEKGPST